ELTMIDLIATDPPYGLKQNDLKVASRGKLAKTTNYGDFDWDVLVPHDLIDMVITRASHSIVFGGNYYGLRSDTCWLIWDKDNGLNDFSDCEMAWTNLPGSLRRIVYRWNGMLQENMKDKERRFHPTQKPVAVLKWAITMADTKLNRKCETICDPFMGSGSTLIAAKQLGRKAVGIEVNEKYCQIAVERLAQTVMNMEPPTEKINQSTMQI
nr:site-specific DNA-methyltransferase [Dehalococcoidales bacterium]